MQSVTAESVASVIFPLTSILERIELVHLFARKQPLEIELGSGDGSFLATYAARHPERNFIGIERLLGRIRKLERKAQRDNLQNLRGVRIESTYFLKHLLPRHSAAGLHVYFPDPWPKRRHQRHRVVNEGFPALAHSSLAPRGVIYLRTDDQAYFEQMTSVFAASAAFHPVETPLELQHLLTDFESEFQARGIITLRAAYQRND